jgi:caa(3)-type oxidase subunit IV
MSVHAPSSPGHPSYVRIWGLLVLLLAISVAGPAVGMLWLTLITAFGVAVVKALMVAAYFMHLKFEQRYIHYLLVAVLAILLVLFAGVAPDVLKSQGQHWQQRVAARPAPAAPGH